ncbi:MAG: hemolysin III family protein [Clostridia bacterium]|nr:hemolysin III family protein [Oscillospiraceae bacterium]MBQ7960900.1 hemolysin III family protein [Clostridia bacterium]
MNIENKPKINNQSLGEEIGNSISHGVGALLSIAGTVVAIVYAALHGDAMSVVSACLYGTGLIILYTASTMYHSLTNYKAKRVFQILDHCSIYILILSSYIPISLSLIRGAMGWVLFGINAGCTALGVTFTAINMKKFHPIAMILYLLMGWSIIFFGIPTLKTLPSAAIWLLVSGGLCYTGGIAFFALKKPRYMHMIWHFFVLAGSILHYFAFLFYTLPFPRTF